MTTYRNKRLSILRRCKFLQIFCDILIYCYQFWCALWECVSRVESQLSRSESAGCGTGAEHGESRVRRMRKRLYQLSSGPSPQPVIHRQVHVNNRVLYNTRLYMRYLGRALPKRCLFLETIRQNVRAIVVSSYHLGFLIALFVHD